MNKLKIVLRNAQAEGFSGLDALRSAFCVVAAFLIPCILR